jgi:predicted amidohydrolase YtcJ
MAPRRLGSDRLAIAYPLRRFVAAGVCVALGSDAPIASEDPWRGVLAAVARTSPGGPPPPVALATEALSLREALAAYSAGAALAAGDDGLGRLEVGALADLSVVHGDPFALEPTALAEVRTALVVVEGRHVAGPLGGELVAS